MNDMRIDELLEQVDSRYGLVLASARRAREINDYTATLGLNESLGIPGPQVHTRSQHPLTIAIEELRDGKLQIALKKPRETDAEAPGARSEGFMDAGPGVSAEADLEQEEFPEASIPEEADPEQEVSEQDASGEEDQGVA